MSANSFAVTKSHYATICLNCSWKQNIQTKISTPQTHPLHNTFLAYCTSLKHCLFCTDQRKTAQSWASTFSSSNTSHISSLWASSKVWKAPCWPTPWQQHWITQGTRLSYWSHPYALVKWPGASLAPWKSHGFHLLLVTRHVPGGQPPWHCGDSGCQAEHLQWQTATFLLRVSWNFFEGKN